MKKYKQPEILPVSQRQLAQYLGISSSMMHMAESSRHPSHQLSAAASGKLAILMEIHIRQQQKKPISRVWQKLQANIKNTAAKEHTILQTTAAHAEAKAKVLANKLKQMRQQETADKYWLSTTDYLLDKLTNTKANQADRKWLLNQQAQAEQRLLKNNYWQQAKIGMQIEQEKLKAGLTRKLFLK